MTGAPAKSDMTVVITGNRITALGKTGAVSTPQNARIVDATGKFLIPGLWDMHSHVLPFLNSFPNTFFPLFVANGVTSVRDMHSEPEALTRVNEETATGRMTGPRIVAASLIVDGPKPLWSSSISVNSADEGRRAVISLKRRGATFVKIYSLIPRESFFAIADEAKKQGITFAGHVPISVTAAEASDAGQKSIEHLLGVFLGCSTEEDKLRTSLLAEIRQSGFSEAVVMRRIFFAPPKRILETYSEQKAEALFARFVRNGTWQVPTLVVWRGETFAHDDKFTNDARLVYVPRPIRDSWNPRNSAQLKALTTTDIAAMKELYERYFPLVGAMRRAGVEFMVGTDTPNPYVFPGFSVHDELVLLVKAGLTKMEALQAATRNPAKYSGMLDLHGTVEQGKTADLVLLDANPLEDIANTQRITAVILNGRYLPRETLQQMLADVKVRVNKN